MLVSDQLHAPVALPPGKEPPYALDRRLWFIEKQGNYDITVQPHTRYASSFLPLCSVVSQLCSLAIGMRLGMMKCDGS
jgi:hypothetical protein